MPDDAPIRRAFHIFPLWLFRYHSITSYPCGFYSGCGFSKVPGDVFIRMIFHLPPSWDISFWFLLQKSAFVNDFSDILKNNKFNKKFEAITPTPYLNSLIPIYLITLISPIHVVGRFRKVALKSRFIQKFRITALIEPVALFVKSSLYSKF